MRITTILLPILVVCSVGMVNAQSPGSIGNGAFYGGRYGNPGYAGSVDYSSNALGNGIVNAGPTGLAPAATSSLGSGNPGIASPTDSASPSGNPNSRILGLLTGGGLFGGGGRGGGGLLSTLFGGAGRNQFNSAYPMPYPVPVPSPGFGGYGGFPGGGYGGFPGYGGGFYG